MSDLDLALGQIIDNNPSQSIIVTVGNSADGPGAPSGVILNTEGPYVTMQWQNGGEPDLAGTKIEWYKPISDPLESAGTWTEVFNVKSSTTEVTKYIGTNQAFVFRLTNYNNSNVFSVPVIAQGSTLNNNENQTFYVLTTPQIDTEYYLWMEYINPGTIPKNEFMAPIYHFGLRNDDSLGGFATSYTDNYSGLLSLYSTDFSNSAINFATKLSGLSYGAALSAFSNNFPYCDPAPGYGEASYGVDIYGPCFDVSDTECTFNIAYYSGTLSGTKVFWNHFNYKNGTFAEISTSSGIYGGFTGEVAGYKTTSALNKPLLLVNSGFVDNQIVVFTTGTQLGFVSINRSGLQNSAVVYNDAGGNLNPQYQFDGCMDNNGGLHVFYQDSSNGGGICWYRYDQSFNQIGSGLNTFQSSIPGEIFAGNNEDNQWGAVRCFCDKRNEISLFIESSSSDMDLGKGTYFYAKVDTSGNLLYSPKSMFTVPFNYSYSNFAYNPWFDNAYSNYYLDSKTQGISEFMPGGYKVSHIFKVISTGTKFESFQTVSR